MQATQKTSSGTCNVLPSSFLLCSNRITLQTPIYRVFNHAIWPIKTRHSHSLCSKQRSGFHVTLHQTASRFLLTRWNGWVNLHTLTNQDEFYWLFKQRLPNVLHQLSCALIKLSKQPFYTCQIPKNH